MGKRFLLSAVTFIFAFGVLFASIFRSASVHYAFSQAPSDIEVNVPKIDYQLPGTGLVGPDDPLWLFEVFRDKVWLNTTIDPYNKAELLVLVADKRIAYAEQLAHRGQYDESIAVAQKAEIYLENAYNIGKLVTEDMSKQIEISNKLALSSLKHRQVLEEIYATAPDDARPMISLITNTPKKIFELSSHMINETNSPKVQNPFAN